MTQGRKNQILALLAVAQLMGVLDFSIVNVALPFIQHEFHLTLTGLQWVVSAYAVMFGGFLLLGGRAADVVGRRRTFLFGLALFSAASLAGGLAPTLAVVVVARAAQGLGAAILSPATLSLVTTTFTGEQERNRALGVFGSVSGVGFGLGVALGGVLLNILNWRWIFFVNACLGVPLLLLAALLLPRQRHEQTTQKLDIVGAVLGTSAIVLVVLALAEVGARGGNLGQSLLTAFAAVILLAGFVLVERRTPDALLPLSIFRSGAFSTANAVSLLTVIIASMLAFVLTLYLQGVLGLAPLFIGLAFLPAGLGGIIGGQVASWGIRRLGLRWGAALGPAILATGVLLLTRITPTNGVPWVVVGYGIAGIGIVCSIVFTTIAATMQVGAKQQGLAAGILGMAQQVGGALGASLAASVAGAVTASRLAGRLVALTAGYAATLWLAVGIAALAGLLGVVAIRMGSSHVTEPDPSTSVREDARALG